ncbi:Cyclin-B1-4 [Lathyrus oleraceus]|uniref:B-like cyclin n=1 Tax=Pisum sativum TaxID=3888 RepID=A0A9D5AT78_PEA|nr:Cyclin-B1-4 [Pisum sativum]
MKEAEVKEKRPLKGRKLRDKSKINVRTFSSVHTARSKAVGRSVPNDLVMGIDATDKDNELAATEYIDDIYKFYKLREGDCPVHDYMVSQPDINAKMRAILIEWLIEVHRKFELMPEIFYLTLNIVDRFLSMKVVPRKELQLIGISSMLIASKYEEIWAPEVTDFVCISDNAYVREQMENMVNFLAELSMMYYVAVSSYSPSMIAASAVYAARCTTRSRNIEAGGGSYESTGCFQELFGSESI